MRKVMLLTKNILRRMMLKPLGIILRIFIVTALFFLFLAIYNIKGDEQVHIGVTDHDKTVSSEAIIALFNQIEGVELYEMDQGYLEYYVQNGDLPVGILINDGFEENIFDSNGEGIEIQSIYSNHTLVWIDQAMESIIDNQRYLYQNVEKNQAAYYRELRSSGLKFLEVEVTEDVYGNNDALIRTYGIYLLLIMLSTMTIAFQIVEEKKLGTFDRIGYSPVASIYFTIANIVANIIVVNLQLILLLILLKVLPWWPIEGNIFIIYVVLFTFAICAVAFGVFIASIAKSSNHANALMSVLLTPTCMIGGCLWPVDQMPEFMKRIALLMPQRWTLDALYEITNNVTWTGIIPNLLVVTAFTILFGMVASRQFMRESFE